MPAMLLWVIKNPVTTALIAAVTALALYAGYLQVERFSMEKQLVSAGIEKQQFLDQKVALQKSVENLTREAKLNEAAQQQLTATVNALTQKSIDDAKTLEDIQNAPTTDDGPLAPVLRRSLNAIGK